MSLSLPELQHLTKQEAFDCAIRDRYDDGVTVRTYRSVRDSKDTIVVSCGGRSLEVQVDAMHLFLSKEDATRHVLAKIDAAEHQLYHASLADKSG